MALAMKQSCEKCAANAPNSAKIFICSYECTFCESCASSMSFICPNCRGELVIRPKRK